MVNIGQILSSMLMKRKHIAKSNADVARRIKMSDILISFYRRVVQIQCHGKKVRFSAEIDAGNHGFVLDIQKLEMDFRNWND